MSSTCPPASAGVVNLYALAADKVELYSEAGKICEATPISDVNPLGNFATITAQCVANVSDYWTSAVISSPDNILLMTITLDSPVEVNAGNTVTLTVTLAWS
jgi:hypothetical protein